jgi:hypothetical protein
VTVATPIARLFTKPITLVTRVAGPEDSYGHPVFTEEMVTVLGYYRQMRTGDQDSLGATVVYENIEVYLPADTPLGPYDAVEIEIHGVNERMEIVGQLAEEWNARVGQVNHTKMLVRRAAP